MLDLPILAGISRKSMIYKVLDSSAKEALNGTTFSMLLLCPKGASILRVHDVKEAVETVELYKKLKKLTMNIVALLLLFFLFCGKRRFYCQKSNNVVAKH
jgi:dihydropteroate synthase